MDAGVATPLGPRWFRIAGEVATPVLDEITQISSELRQELLSDVSRDDLRVAWKLPKELGDRLEKP